MQGYFVIPQLLTAAVLLLSGVAKVREPVATSDAFTALRLPRFLTRLGAPALLPWAELLLGAALIVSSGQFLVVASGAALILFLAYVVVIARALGFAHPVRCGCFGALGDHAVTRRTLVRNLVLVATGLLGLIGALLGESTLRVVTTDPGSLGWIGGAALTGVVAVLILGGGPRGTDQASRPAATISASGGRRGHDAALVLTDPQTQRPIRLSTLADTVLVFLEPGCGACERLAETLPTQVHTTRSRVRPVIPDTDTSMAAPLTEPLEDPAGNVGMALVGALRPAAVVLDADGTPGVIAEGALEVRALLEQSEPPLPSVSTPPSPPEVTVAVEAEGTTELDDYVRTTTPAAVLLGPDGSPVLLTELTRQAPVLLIEINCLCSPSRAVLPKLREWAERLPVVRVLLVVTFDPATLPSEPDVADITYRDHGAVAAAALGITGSPVAVLLGADGQLAGGPVPATDIDLFVDDIEAELRANGLLDNDAVESRS